MKKRVLSLVLAFVLSFSMMPMSAFAEEAGTVTEQETQNSENTADVSTTGEKTTGEDTAEASATVEDISGGNAGTKDAEVEAVQALIDALPEEVTADNADGLQAQLMAIGEALAALDAAQTARLNMTRLENVYAALNVAVAAQDAHDHTNMGLTEWTAQNSLPENAGSYYLACDVTLPTTWRPKNNTILCLNGHSITMGADGDVIIVDTDVTFTLLNCILNQNGITHGTNSEGTKYTGHGVNVKGKFHMNGGAIFGNIAECGGGVYVDGGTFNMLGKSFIDGNNAKSSGGGVYVTNNGTFCMNQGCIGGGVQSLSAYGDLLYKSNENTAVNGGDVYVHNGTFNMSGGEIRNNTVTQNGSGVFVDSQGTFTMAGGEICNGNGAQNGGGVYVNGTFNMTRGTISNNKAAQNGGGVFVNNNSRFSMTGGKIEGNTAECGGGVYYPSDSSQATFKLSGGSVINSNKKADGTANNVYVFNSNPIQLTGALTDSAYISVSPEKLPESTDDHSVKVAAGSDQDVIAAVAHFAVDGGAGSGYKIGSIEDSGAYITVEKLASHQHPICGDESCSEHGESVEWTAIGTEAELRNAKAGTAEAPKYYYLLNDVELTNNLNTGWVWTPNKNMVLCLNGHSIKMMAGTIAMEVNNNFTLCDCRGTGKVMHGRGYNDALRDGNAVVVSANSTFTMYGGIITDNIFGGPFMGGAVYVRPNATFNMHGGKITGNQADTNAKGAGVYVAGTFNMTGGEITNNTASWKRQKETDKPEMVQGGGVYVFNTGKVNVSGDAKIYDNWSQLTESNGTIVDEKSADNVYLKTGTDGNPVKITVDGALNDAKIHVTTEAAIAAGTYAVIAEGTENYALTGNDLNAFSSDDTGNTYDKKLKKNSIIFSNGEIHEHGICGKEGCNEDGHGDIVWKGITKLEDIQGDGNYYLLNSVELGSYWECTKKVKLCLNGCTITGVSGIAVIEVLKGGSLEITDCKEEVGKITHKSNVSGRGIYVNESSLTLWNGSITGNKDGKNGGGVNVESGGVFTMNGGSITGNTSTATESNNGKGGGGVYVAKDCVFTMNSGSITGNTSAAEGGGVYVANGGTFTMNGGTITGNNTTTSDKDRWAGGVYVGTSGVFTVSGTVQITDNWKNGRLENGVYVRDENSTKGNVYLPGSAVGKRATITIGTAGLTQEARIGVSKSTVNLPTVGNNVQIVAGAKNSQLDYTKIFQLDVDDPSYTVICDEDNSLAIYNHQHQWTYTAGADGQTIHAVCNVTGCPKKEGGSVTIKAPEHVVYGDGKAADAMLNVAEWQAAAVTVDDIEYQQDGKHLASAPTNAGTYCALITKENAKASVTYTINSKEVTEPIIEVADAGTYDGNPKTPSVTVKDGKTLIPSAEYEVSYENNTNAGNATVTITDAAGGNYSVTGRTTFTIGQATITVTPETGQKKIYGDGDPTLKYNVSGTVNNETPAFNGALSRINGTNVGEYEITQDTLKLMDSDGFNAANYQLEFRKGVNFNITPRPVTITGISADDKTYDGTNTAVIKGTPAISGLVVGDENDVTVEPASAKATFADADAGTAKTVTFNGYALTGTKAGNYTLSAQPASVTANISPKELTITDVMVEAKAYDGTTTATVTGVTFNGLVNSESLTKDKDYTVTGNFGDAAVGKNKNVAVTVKLAGSVKNYTLSKTGYTKNGCKIVKAAVAAPATTNLTIINGSSTIYTVMLPQLLPSPVSPGEYGKLTYNDPQLKITDSSYDGAAEVRRSEYEYGKLALQFNKTGTTEGPIGTITVTVHSDNYQDIILTINILATAKIVPQREGTLKLTPSEITYGEKLSNITISGTMTAGGRAIPGTFTWENLDAVLNAGNQQATWKFTPDDTQIYAETTGTTTVKVNRAEQSGAVLMDNYTYNETPKTPDLTDRKGDPNAAVTYYYSTTRTNSGGTEWKGIGPTTLKAGTYYMYAVIGETGNYKAYTTEAKAFEVWKAAPTYIKPSGLTAKYGQKLSEITLPNPAGNMPGTWSWEAPDTVIDKTGTVSYDAYFTPDDTNYMKVVGAASEITVARGDGRNLATEELTLAFNDGTDHTYTPDWSELPAGQTWNYECESSIGSGSNAKFTKLNVSAADGGLTYAVSDGQVADKITVILKACCSNYKDFTITLHIQITKAAPAGEPKYTLITTGGKTLADAGLTLNGSTLNPADGTLEWVGTDGNVLSDDTEVKVNTTYKWRFTPADTNYNSLTGEIELYHVDAPAISAQPKSVSVTVGEKATFEVTATGTDVTYQWKIDRNDGNGFVDITGATGAAYTTGVTDKDCDGFKYQCVIRNAAGSATTDTVVLTVLYQIIEGANGSWNQSTDGESLRIRGNGEYSKFQNVKVDGNIIDSKNYTVSEGSTIIELHADYLKTLSEGSHTFEIVWTDGAAGTGFTVARNTSGSNNTGSNNTGNNDNNDSTDNSAAAAPTAATAQELDKVPATGDASGIWIALFVVSAVGLAAMLVRRKKQ